MHFRLRNTFSEHVEPCLWEIINHRRNFNKVAPDAIVDIPSFDKLSLYVSWISLFRLFRRFSSVLLVFLCKFCKDCCIPVLLACGLVVGIGILFFSIFRILIVVVCIEIVRNWIRRLTSWTRHQRRKLLGSLTENVTVVEKPTHRKLFFKLRVNFTNFRQVIEKSFVLFLLLVGIFLFFILVAVLIFLVCFFFLIF